MEIPRRTKHICCNHVYNRQKDVLLVERSEESFQFLCGGHHGEGDGPELMAESDLVKMDSSLSTVFELKANHAIERKSKGDVWAIRYSYGGDVNPKYIKSCNDDFIKENHGLDFGYLPEVSVKGLRVRAIGDVKYRAAVLAVIVQVSFEIITANDALIYLKEYDLYRFLSEKEKEFLQGPTDEAAKNNETWKSECLSVLLWSLGMEMDLYDAIELSDLDSFPATDFPFLGLNKSPDHFLGNAKLAMRSEEDLFMAFDHFSRLDYICDWSVINAREVSLSSALIYERRYALTWLLFDVSWDLISCDSIV